jgi:two-component system chemotaxis response regulator CheB
MTSSLTTTDADVTLRALAAGASDYVAKPSSGSLGNKVEDVRRELIAKIRAIGRRKKGTGLFSHISPAAVSPLTIVPLAQPYAVAIGSSTGGPNALVDVLTGLGSDFEYPVFITQHMPPLFTAMLAERLQKYGERPCREALEGELVEKKSTYLAPGDFHMTLKREKEGVFIHLNQNPPENYCRPAVDPMLRSVAEVYGKHVLVLILTGMGEDGRRGCEQVVTGGGEVVAQDEPTSVVWGMPGAVAHAGLASKILPLSDIAQYIKERCAGKRL